MLVVWIALVDYLFWFVLTGFTCLVIVVWFVLVGVVCATDGFGWLCWLLVFGDVALGLGDLWLVFCVMLIGYCLCWN